MESFSLVLGKVILDGAIAFIALLLWKLDILERNYSFYSEKLSNDYVRDPKDITYLKNAIFLSKIEYLDIVTLQPNDKSFLLNLLKSSSNLKTIFLPLLIYLLIFGFLLQCYGLLEY